MKHRASSLPRTGPHEDMRPRTDVRRTRLAELEERLGLQRRRSDTSPSRTQPPPTRSHLGDLSPLTGLQNLAEINPRIAMSEPRSPVQDWSIHRPQSPKSHIGIVNPPLVTNRQGTGPGGPGAPKPPSHQRSRHLDQSTHPRNFPPVQRAPELPMEALPSRFSHQAPSPRQLTHHNSNQQPSWVSPSSIHLAVLPNSKGVTSQRALVSSPVLPAVLSSPLSQDMVSTRAYPTSWDQKVQSVLAQQRSNIGAYSTPDVLSLYQQRIPSPLSANRDHPSLEAIPSGPTSHRSRRSDYIQDQLSRATHSPANYSNRPRSSRPPSGSSMVPPQGLSTGTRYYEEQLGPTLVQKQVQDLKGDFNERAKRWESQMAEVTSKINLLTERVSCGSLGEQRSDGFAAEATALRDAVQQEVHDIKSRYVSQLAEAESRIQTFIERTVAVQRDQLAREWGGKAATLKELKTFFEEDLPEMKKMLSEGRTKRKDLAAKIDSLIENQSATWLSVLDSCQKSCEQTKLSVDSKIEAVIDFCVERLDTIRLKNQNLTPLGYTSRMNPQTHASEALHARAPLVQNYSRQTKSSSLSRPLGGRIPSPPRFDSHAPLTPPMTLDHLPPRPPLRSPKGEEEWNHLHEDLDHADRVGMVSTPTIQDAEPRLTASDEET